MKKERDARALDIADNYDRCDLKGDDQAIFKDGIEFGFKRGWDSAIKYIKEEAQKNCECDESLTDVQSSGEKS